MLRARRFIKFFSFFALITFLFTQTLYDVTLTENLKDEKREIPIVLVICKGKVSLSFKAEHGDVQHRQAMVIIKSIMALSSRNITIIVLTNEEIVFSKILEGVERWPKKFTNRFTLEMRYIYTPQMSSMMNLFEPCSAQRLYLPWVLPDYDAALYMDSDMFFMTPPENLIDQIYQFDENEIFGLTSADGWYLQQAMPIPYVLPRGVNGAPLLANLTRWRQLRWDWRATVAEVALHFDDRMTLGDQDILNLILMERPHLLHQLACGWSGSVEQCISTDVNCTDIEHTGLLAVHGVRGRFFILYPDAINTNQHQLIPLQILFRAWEEHVLGAPLRPLLDKMLQKFEDLEQKGLAQDPTQRYWMCISYSYLKLFKPLIEHIHNL